MTSAGLLILGGGLAGAAGSAFCWFALRPRCVNWGAGQAEVEAAMPGDEVIPNPAYVSTHAVTIKAQREDVWPWLVQMGHQRGGLYTYDWIAQRLGLLDGPSAERIIPELQHLDIGDVIPIGHRRGWSVEELEPNRFLLVRLQAPAIECVWAWVLSEVDESHTRLVLRTRSRWRSPLLAPLSHLVGLCSFLITRKHLLGIKQRAEIAAWQTEEWLSGRLCRASWLPHISFSRQWPTTP
jgi:hypothetical protein